MTKRTNYEEPKLPLIKLKKVHFYLDFHVINDNILLYQISAAQQIFAELEWSVMIQLIQSAYWYGKAGMIWAQIISSKIKNTSTILIVEAFLSGA